ncbi:MAG TPA: hypothetical protein IAB38_03645 [Candidatus Onthousia excrementipullorum]|uniref:Uncharacterized protein n=1 Tax=Candidatus Onthousia excrementipullorum TaxID=2840884 RepID=A0A9D1J335_9FIRM|nr:hypothetical protein [Candidatus Onthousia excrementipullorum]
MNERKKYIIISVVIILISVVALIGTSYALLTMTIEGDKKITLTAGILKVDFEDGNYINLENAAPMTDSQGQKLTPYTFTITNTGNINAYYHVSLEEEATNTLTNNYLKMRLTNDAGYDSGVVKVNSYGTGTFDIKSEETLEPSDTVTYTLWMWLDNDADNSAQGKEYKSKIVVTSYDRPHEIQVSTALLDNISEENLYDDGTDTFITGEDPNNYIWYSGKLWRAVSVNNEAKTTKLVTQWNISSISYNEINNSSFEGSYMEDWLNDTTVDGFLGNLRDYENFIVTDAKWNATEDATSLGSITRPSDSGTVVTDAVGLLNMYEYQSSNKGGINGYLNNGLYWWTLTPNSSTTLVSISPTGETITDLSHYADGIRPSINLRSDVKIVSGSGTENDPYRLLGDSDTNLSGTKLNTRYSGEYIRFGTGDNNLYRIVSHETPELTKIVNSEPLKENGEFINLSLNPNEVKDFINNVFISDYFEDGQFSMISENTVWYWSSVSDGESYKLAKYKNINGDELISNTSIDTIGLLRLGELMTGQFNRYTSRENVNTGLTSKYWLNTMEGDKNKYVQDKGGLGIAASGDSGLKLAFNLKSNVIITGGDGTKNNPFILELAS